MRSRETDGFLYGRPPPARAGEPVADDPQRLDPQAGVVLADADGDDAQMMAHDPETTPRRVRLRVTPLTLREANAYIVANHRHHGETRGCIVVCACSDEDGEIRGVGIVGRPVARMLQDGFTAEVTRLCTDGTPNACSILYGALWRAVRALGYHRLVTYTLPEEGGGSLRASGFALVGEAGGGSWHRPANGRPRIDLHPTQEKLRWERAV